METQKQTAAEPLTTTEDRQQALIDFLIESKEFTKEELKELTTSEYDSNIFEVAGREYRVLDDDEADAELYDYIKDSVWAFNPSFLSYHTDIDESVFKLLQEKCEGANDAILGLIKDFDKFVRDAEWEDGRGHFLNPYDGSEELHNGFYIYRVN